MHVNTYAHWLSHIVKASHISAYMHTPSRITACTKERKRQRASGLQRAIQIDLMSYSHSVVLAWLGYLTWHTLYLSYHLVFSLCLCVCRTLLLAYRSSLIISSSTISFPSFLPSPSHFLFPDHSLQDSGFDPLLVSLSYLLRMVPPPTFPSCACVHSSVSWSNQLSLYGFFQVHIPGTTYRSFKRLPYP